MLTPKEMNLANNLVSFTKEVKFLGVYVNEFLDWSQHIAHLSAKLNSVCYCFRTVCKYMNKNSIRMIYFANFNSLMRFGIVFWGSCSLVEKIFVIQKRVIRIMCGMGFLQTCRSVFRTNDILTVYAVYIYECLLFVFKNMEKFDIGSTHTYDTRNRNLVYPLHRLTCTEKGLQYMGIKLYNSLPDWLKSETNLNVYKTRLKKILIAIEPYSMKEFYESVKNFQTAVNM